MASREQMKQALMASVVPLEESTPHLKGMIYGESGVGKTVAALQVMQSIVPKDKAILYLDAVEGWVSLINHPGLKSRVTRMQYQGLSQMNLITELINEGDEWASQFGGLVIDEISVIAQLDLDNVVKAQTKNDPSRDPDLPIWPDMNINTHRVRKALIAMQRLPIHQIYLSHIREDEDKSKGYKVIRPEFMPKTSTTIRNGLHIIAHMTANDKTVDGNKVYVRSLQTHPTKTVVAKSRIGGLGVHCSVDTLIEKINGWIGGKVKEVEIQEVIDDSSLSQYSDDDPVIEVK